MSAARSAGGGAMLGFLFVIIVIILVAMTNGYRGNETPAPCTSADWKAYAPACNRWSPGPDDHPPVIVPQKTGK